MERIDEMTLVCKENELDFQLQVNANGYKWLLVRNPKNMDKWAGCHSMYEVEKVARR